MVGTRGTCQNGAGRNERHQGFAWGLNQAIRKIKERAGRRAGRGASREEMRPSKQQQRRRRRLGGWSCSRLEGNKGAEGGKGCGSVPRGTGLRMLERPAQGEERGHRGLC